MSISFNCEHVENPELGSVSLSGIEIIMCENSCIFVLNIMYLLSFVDRLLLL
jgi:hypothetical protein